MSYVIASPGRTGSFFLTDFLTKYSEIAENKMFYRYTILEHYTDLENLPSNFVIHCHSVAAIPIFTQNRKLIINTRNPIEIVASAMVAMKTNVFHFESTGMNIDDYLSKYSSVQFDFSEQSFLKLLKHNLQWYVDAFQYVENATILNYHQAIDIKEINEILKLKTIEIPNDLPVAQPLDKWKLIKNSDNLKKIGNTVFKHYQEKYPNIFIEEYFKY
jgi:hypothetical protein